MRRVVYAQALQQDGDGVAALNAVAGVEIAWLHPVGCTSSVFGRCKRLGDFAALDPIELGVRRQRRKRSARRTSARQTAPGQPSVRALAHCH